MNEVRLTLPFPPTVNHYYGKRAVRSKKTGKLTVVNYLTKVARDYRYTVCEMMYEQLGKAPELRGRLSMQVRLFNNAQTRSHDYDNGLKPIGDALEYSRVFINDSQIDQALIIKKRRTLKPRVEIIINEM